MQLVVSIFNINKIFKASIKAKVKNINFLLPIFDIYTIKCLMVQTFCNIYRIKACKLYVSFLLLKKVLQSLLSRCLSLESTSL